MNRMVVQTDLGEVVVNHNSDWSGTAIVSWGFAPDPKWPGHEKAAHTVEMPGALLVALGRGAALAQVRSAVIRTLEQLGPEPNVLRCNACRDAVEPTERYARRGRDETLCRRCFDRVGLPPEMRRR